MHQEMMVLNPRRNVTLTAYTQDVGGKFCYIPKRPAVLILPGGAYQYCSDREADPVAFCYLKAGFQAFVLRYSVGEHAVWPNPLEDVEAALELIRSREDWNVYPDKVAVIGFSAGGHLAAAAATMAKERPNAAILGYAVAGADVRACIPNAPDTTAYIDRNTCPCFVFATRTDEIVPIRNSIDFIRALADANISFESHIYAYGPHGFSTCEPSVQEKWVPICDRAGNWVGDSIRWLHDIFGDFGDGEMTKPTCGSKFTGDDEPFLSTECTLGHLLKNPQAAELMDPLVKQMEAMGVQGEGLQEMAKRLPLRTLLGYARTSRDAVMALDDVLKQIPNET